MIRGYTLEQLDSLGTDQLRKLINQEGIEGWGVQFVRKQEAISFLSGQWTESQLWGHVWPRRKDKKDKRMIDFLKAKGFSQIIEGDTEGFTVAKVDNKVKSATKLVDHKNYGALKVAAKAMEIDLEQLHREFAEKLEKEISNLQRRLEETKKEPWTKVKDDNWNIPGDFVKPIKGDLVVSMLRRNVQFMLVGPHGSGKSVLVRWGAKELNRKVYTLSCHGDMLADSLEGSSRVVVKDGKTEQVFIPGIIQKAMEEGAILLLDELDRASSSVQILLNGVAQTHTFLIRDGQETGKTIVAKEGFLVVATGNSHGGSTGEYNSNNIDKSTLSRFRVVFVSYDEGAERQILAKKGLNQTTINRVMKAVNMARKEWRESNLPTAIGTRAISFIGDDLVAGLDFEEAWELNIANHQGDQEGDPFVRRAMNIVKQVA